MISDSPEEGGSRQTDSMLDAVGRIARAGDLKTSFVHAQAVEIGQRYKQSEAARAETQEARAKAELERARAQEAFLLSTKWYTRQWGLTRFFAWVEIFSVALLLAALVTRNPNVIWLATIFSIGALGRAIEVVFKPGPGLLMVPASFDYEPEPVVEDTLRDEPAAQSEPSSVLVAEPDGV